MNLILAGTLKQLHNWLRCKLIVDSEMNFIFKQCPNPPLLGSGVSLHAFMKILELYKMCPERSVTSNRICQIQTGQWPDVI